MQKKLNIWIRRFLIGALIVLIGLQFFQIDKENPVADTGKDFLNSSLVSQEIKSAIQAACYDCHSYNTEYPWYTSISPINYWIKGHYEHGREKLNFSLWQDYEAKRQRHKLEECIEEIKENHMPLKSYTWMHPNANLSNQEKEMLVNYFEQKIKSIQ